MKGKKGKKPAGISEFLGPATETGAGDRFVATIQDAMNRSKLEGQIQILEETIRGLEFRIRTIRHELDGGRKSSL